MSRRLATRLFAPLAALALGIALTPATAEATRLPDYLVGEATLEVAHGPTVRSERRVTDRVLAPEAWADFAEAAGGEWTAMWDTRTRVPLRIWGSGLAYPGSVDNGDIAAQASRDLLARHLELLAPGSELSDFILVGNEVHHGVRSVGFRQLHQGREVLGGQVSFRFKHDRMLAIGSEALPHLSATPVMVPVEPQLASRSATDWLRFGAGIDTVATGFTGPRVLALVPADDGPIEAREVVTVTVEGTSVIGRWDVHVDAGTGQVVARQQTLRFGTGTALYNVPERWPGATRLDYEAAFADLTVDGAGVTTDVSGGFTWNGTNDASVVATTSGPDVDVNHSGAGEVAANFTVADNGTLVLDLSNSEEDDAEVTSFIHTRFVRDWLLALDPSNGWGTQQADVNVNINDVCNAYYDGSTINFFQSGGGCGNTGRIADVVYHEYGHGVHDFAIIPGVGSFDGSLGEGLADYVSVALTDDSGMGRGFFNTSDPLRELNPAGSEWFWPDDSSPADIHGTGRIIGGALYDMRVLLQGSLGNGAGSAAADEIFYGVAQRSVDIPSTWTEALVADDDDGDLANGTPNFCDLLEAFEAHGLATGNSDVGVQKPVHAGRTISVDIVDPGCPGFAPLGAELEWRLRSDPLTGGTLPMTQAGDTWTATFPEQAGGEVVEYQVRVDFTGRTETLPSNPADEWYQFFQGTVSEIWCTEFETDPANDGWTIAGPGTPAGATDWMWGAPQGSTDGTDPVEPWSGGNAYGNDLAIPANYNGLYQANVTNSSTSQVISVASANNPRLQLRRWLAVEDGYFDQARIYVNGTLAWENRASIDPNSANVHHHDAEWRFVDLDLSPFVTNDEVQVTFELQSDAGLEFGGWAIDDFCVVDWDPNVATGTGTGIGTTGTGTGSTGTGTGTTTPTTGTGTGATTGTGTGATTGTGTGATTGTGTGATTGTGTGATTGTGTGATTGTGTGGSTGAGTGTGGTVPDPDPNVSEDDSLPVLVDGRSSCGCDNNSGSAPGLALGLLGLLAIRRRR